MTVPTHTLTAAAALAAGLTPGVIRLAAATPTPVPQPAAATGPGIAGFLVTFALVLACIPLFLSMTRKVRGVAYRDGAATDGGVVPTDETTAPDAAEGGPAADAGGDDRRDDGRAPS